MGEALGAGAAVMQVNTKMPQFVQRVAGVEDRRQAGRAAQGLPAAEIDRTAKAYGPAVDDPGEFGFWIISTRLVSENDGCAAAESGDGSGEEVGI